MISKPNKLGKLALREKDWFERMKSTVKFNTWENVRNPLHLGTNIRQHYTLIILGGSQYPVAAPKFSGSNWMVQRSATMIGENLVKSYPPQISCYMISILSFIPLIFNPHIFPHMSSHLCSLNPIFLLVTHLFPTLAFYRNIIFFEFPLVSNNPISIYFSNNKKINE